MRARTQSTNSPRVILPLPLVLILMKACLSRSLRFSSFVLKSFIDRANFTNSGAPRDPTPFVSNLSKRTPAHISNSSTLPDPSKSNISNCCLTSRSQSTLTSPCLSSVICKNPAQSTSPGTKLATSLNSRIFALTTSFVAWSRAAVSSSASVGMRSIRDFSSRSRNRFESSPAAWNSASVAVFRISSRVRCSVLRSTRAAASAKRTIPNRGIPSVSQIVSRNRTASSLSSCTVGG
mmetsp:Transcript_28189/g.45381  ORF Transcript_28189/g.45381 Transcript_28189/m.45381 type:complete len:235 (+) Transcript_28189:734-1438(+)